MGSGWLPLKVSEQRSDVIQVCLGMYFPSRRTDSFLFQEIKVTDGPMG